METYDIVIVGSGPAGLLAALRVSEKHSVLLLERPDRNFRLGKRILVSGNGRANFFHEDLLTFSHPLLQPISSYLPLDTGNNFLSYLTSRFGFTYRKEGKLYYPYFNRSECLWNPLIQAIEKSPNITIRAGEALSVNGKKLLIASADRKKTEIGFSHLILALGGRSLDRTTYSDALLDSLSLKRYPFSPALCPIRVKEKIPAYLEKQRLKARLKLFSQEKLLYQEEGEVLFKADGLSGICVFDSTIYLEDSLRKNRQTKYSYQIDYGGENAGIDSYPAYLRRYLTERNLPLSNPLNFTYASLYPFTDSQISYGGVLLSEIEENAFALNTREDVHLLGEMLDVNLPCGGYNMGLSFLEGYQVGGLFS